MGSSAEQSDGAPACAARPLAPHAPEAIAELGRRAIAGADLPDLFEQAVSIVASTLAIDLCALLEWLRDEDVFVLRAGIGWREGGVGVLRVPAREAALAGFALAAREPVVVDDLEAETRFRPPPLLVEHGARSGITVPIRGRGADYGVLGAHVRERRRFASEEVHLLQGIANVLGAAIERRRAEQARRRAEAALAERTAVLEAIFETTTDTIFVKDLEGRYIMINPAVTAATGRRPDEVVGKRDHDLFDAATASALVAADRAALAAGRVTLVEERLGDRTYLTMKAPFRDARGEVAGIIGISRDMTERKRVEESLRASEELLRATFDQAAVGIVLLGLDRRLRRVNRKILEMLGYEESELLGRSVAEFSPPEDLEGDEERFARLVAGEIPGYVHEKRCFRKDGSFQWSRVAISLVRDATGAPSCAIAVVEDVSARRAAEEALRASEEQLRQAQKMEAIGRLAGGVAHDFNNILTAIAGHGHFLLERLRTGDPARADAEQVIWAADRASALTRQLLAFSRRQVLQPRLLDLGVILAGMERMLRRLLGEDIELAIAVAPDLGSVRADPGQIEQVILNLAVNARDAMPRGGRLLIEADNVELDEAFCQRHRGATAGPYVLLSVADTGVGLTDEVKAHLFEPFFTTKARGKGTGLGLSTVYGIVKQSGGTIWAEGANGAGARFDIYLPRAGEPAEPLPAPSPSAGEGGRGSETILVVEDDPSVRRLVTEALTARGYRVVATAAGAEAIAVARRQDAPIDLLLTDVVMPGMSGREVAAGVARFRPGVRVLFMSGYTDDMIARHGVLDRGTDLIEKPFTPEALARRVRAALDAR